jgi:anaerobic selenocysteine-containing dehydrogenase
LTVAVENGRVVTIDGSHRNAATAGFICAKVRRFGDRVYGEARLRHPGLRKGPKGSGKFCRATWSEALELIAARMRAICDEDGPEAILPFCYGGSNGLLTQDTADAVLFRRLGTSRLARTVCAAPTGAAAQAMYGKMPGVTYADYTHARLIVIWGANPSASGIHLIPFVQEAQRKGATLIVVDPRRTPLARRADLHVQLRPGTDLPVALSLHRYLFEGGLADQGFLIEHARGAERLRAKAAAWSFDRAAATAGVDPGLLGRFAELYASTSPAVLRCGWGLERNRNGGNAALAVLALPAVAGKFGVRGGGYTMSNSGAWGLKSSSWIGVDEQKTRIVNMNHLGRALLEYTNPPIKMLFVYNCNPVATMPDQRRVITGLEREDLFTVVFEQARTDTVAYADVVLPATTFLETYDLARSYGPLSLQLVSPVIDAVGESRSNGEVFSELATLLGVESGIEQDCETLLRIVSRLPEQVGQELMSAGIAKPACGTEPIQFVDVYPATADRKIDLFPEHLAVDAPAGLYGYQADPASGEYPLALISPASEKTISSTLGELRERPGAVHMHPADAAARGLEENDAVRVYNALGEVHCPVRITENVKVGTIAIPKGLWRKSTYNQLTANALVSDSLTDIGGGACFNDARVEVAKIVTAAWGDEEIALFVPATPPTN